MATTLRPRALTLLRELKRNNDREWYGEHKAELEAELFEPLARVLEEASAALARTKMPLTGGRKTMFRMNRDVRFSASKLPYKVNAGGVLTVDGTKKSQGTGGLGYLHCEPGESFIAAGFYMPETAWLEPVRRRMIEDAAAWRRVRRALERVGLALSRERALKSMPRGFADARGHEHAESLQLTSLVVLRPLANEDWTKGDVGGALATLVKEARPLLEFCREASVRRR